MNRSTNKVVDPYDVLGVKWGASDVEIKEAYRRLMKECHPDVHQDEKKKADAEGRAKDINVAYDLLSDPQKKAAYDAPPQHPQFGGGIDINDIISRMFGGNGGGFFNFGGMSGGKGNPNMSYQQTYQQSFDVDVFTLILGGEIGVKFSDGQERRFTIPPNTPVGAKFQVKLDKNTVIILVPNVIIPKLSEEKLKKLREVMTTGT
jgi:DnaJ-class molecular chaperone